jgi:hypothetical protein
VCRSGEVERRLLNIVRFMRCEIIFHGAEAKPGICRNEFQLVTSLIRGDFDNELALATAHWAICQLRTRISPTLMLSTTLPDNQWELEVQNANNVTLAIIRALVTWHAFGNDVPISRTETIRQFVTEDKSAEMLQPSQNQRLWTTTNYPFNVAGLVSIVISGCLTLLLRYSSPPLVSRMRKRERC